MLNIISFLEILLRFRMISQKYVSLLGLSKIIRNNSKLTFVGFPDALSFFSNRFKESELRFFSRIILHSIPFPLLRSNQQLPFNMPQILEDLTQAICPTFEGEEWDFLRQPMIDVHRGDQPLTVDEATQRMKEAWTRENNRKVAAWNEQLEQDQAEQDEQDRLA
jgi:hypothetical protein